ncbi:glycogen debranching protein [Patescibacteria group bacterium]|nr:glycogen debranching protein [Patescibacteria group bacterium]
MKKSIINDNLCDKAYKEALKTLRHCIHPVGIKASAGVRGYPQVWARDSMITLLGAVLIKDDKVIHSLKSVFKILIKKQSQLGCIPNNVDVKTLRANFQAYADGGLWFVIGSAFFFKQTGDSAFLKSSYLSIQKTLTWYEHQDVDQTGLITIAEASDWEDLFATRGKGLYVNILYYIALCNAVDIAKHLRDKKHADIYAKKAKKIYSCINKYFWYKGDDDISSHLKFSFGTEFFNKKDLDSLKRKNILPSKRILKKSLYYLPYLSFREFGEWFDSFGNLLAILSGIADKKRSEILLEFIKKFKLTKPYPIKAIYPPIFPGEKDWRNYYKFANLNLPNQYHNGGIWPFLGGFYVAALVKMKKYSEAREALESLALLNKQGKKSSWEFNEWAHGETAKPMGMAEQAWSAGMYIYAYEAVKQKKTLFF